MLIPHPDCPPDSLFLWQQNPSNPQGWFVLKNKHYHLIVTGFVPYLKRKTPNETYCINVNIFHRKNADLIEPSFSFTNRPHTAPSAIHPENPPDFLGMELAILRSLQRHDATYNYSHQDLLRSPLPTSTALDDGIPTIQLQ